MLPGSNFVSAAEFGESLRLARVCPGDGNSKKEPDWNMAAVRHGGDIPIHNYPRGRQHKFLAEMFLQKKGRVLIFLDIAEIAR